MGRRTPLPRPRHHHPSPSHHHRDRGGDRPRPPGHQRLTLVEGSEVVHHLKGLDHVRSRSDQAHVATQDVPLLRALVLLQRRRTCRSASPAGRHWPRCPTEDLAFGTIVRSGTLSIVHRHLAPRSVLAKSRAAVGGLDDQADREREGASRIATGVVRTKSSRRWVAP